MAQDKLDVARVQAAVQESRAGWQAGVTSVSELPRDERLKRLGATPPPGVTLEEIARLGEAQRASVLAARAVGAPAAFDWRNANGANYITPIKDQGGCGSCVAFASCATIEGTFRVQRSDPNLNVDLSEAHLFYCLGRAVGVTCGTGWLPEPAMEAAKNTGITDEGCYPYTAEDQNCTGLCGDWQSRAIKLTGHHTVGSAADMKTWISTRGPLAACFIVYDDFFSYRSGVYSHVTGNQAGGHCVSILGYDDVAGCWICKNSWGAGWGDSGFFRIAYGQCAIETWQVSAVDGILESGWLNNTRVVGVWALDQDRNAWAYLDGAGWRRISADNDNIFFDMLSQLLAAKAANRPINVFQDNGVIKQVYVF
jgi:C1A family cysteine protease